MTSPAVELQELVFAALKADAGVAAFTTQVWDSVPETRTFPYITIGEDDIVSADAECIVAGNHGFNVHVWTRSVGRTESKNIAHAVKNALTTGDLALDEHALASLVYRSDFEIGDPDQLTGHRVVKFEARIEES